MFGHSERCKPNAVNDLHVPPIVGDNPIYANCVRCKLRLAVRNVAQWGDTDVLPFPLENHWFHDDEKSVVELLSKLDADYDGWKANYPVFRESILAAVGYTGFRAATQIDPIWNAYLLACTLEIADDLEQDRLPVESERVFSYRYLPDEKAKSLFSRSISWAAFQQRALKLSDGYSHVLSTDITNFYPRVYHHRIENGIKQSTKRGDVAKRIIDILGELSSGRTSYGLPVGGNASRILAEVSLGRTDQLLTKRGIEFCRYVDDYYLFGHSEHDVRRALAYLAQCLSLHDGLSLSRGKTRIMTAAEFQRNSPVTEKPNDTTLSEQARSFLQLRLLYDPYSPTADEDYEKLKEELAEFDMVGILTQELHKSRIDEALVRQLVKSIQYLEDELKGPTLVTLARNLQTLYPVFPTVALTIKRLIGELKDAEQEQVFSILREAIDDGSYVFDVPANMMFAIRVLSEDRSEETELLLARIFEQAEYSALRRDIILAMAKRRSIDWLADAMRRLQGHGGWEFRAFIAASYTLGDEGHHWRQRKFSDVDDGYKTWLGTKNNGKPWSIPL